MSQRTLSVLLLMFVHFHNISASDPDSVEDFCILDTESTASVVQCKNSSLATVEDFVFSGIRSQGKFSATGLAATSVNSKAFPGLHTLGMSFVRADLETGGINPPHFHPRATEVAYVLEGSIYSGFVDTDNRIFAKVIEKGEVMLFPRGLIHFQMNVGETRATILGTFNSENPGLQRIPSSMFGSGIEAELLEKAFGLSPKEVERLKRRFAPQQH